MTRGPITVLALLLACGGSVHAAELVLTPALASLQPATDQPAEPTERPKLSTPAEDRKARAAFDVYADHALSADFTDADGELSITRLATNFQMVFPVFSDSQIGVAIGAQRWSFDFKDAAAFDAADGDPWSGVNVLDVTLTFSNQINEHWSYVAGTFGRASFADGAELTDSLGGGLILGATRKLSDTLSIGGGLSVRSQLEDEWSVLPLITLDWKISETFRLKTTPSVGRRLFALTYTPIEALELSLGTGIESIDFRLDDESPAPKGVGRFRRIPVGVDITYNFSRQVSASLYGGMLFAQELTLDDSDGERIQREALDATPFFGGGFQWRF